MGKPDTTATPYQRLPGKKRRFFGYERLWLGPDHLLLLRSHNYYEDYKRFYFKDIQALLLRKTSEGRIFNLICGILIGLCLLPTASLDKEIALIFWVMAAFFFLLLVINVLFGPTCACHLKTAVQTEKLAALGRLRKARKVINRLSPLIHAAQAGLNPPGSGGPAGDSSRRLPPPQPAALSQKTVKVTIHMLLFGLLLVLGLFWWSKFHQNQVVLALLEAVCYMTTGIIAIAALVRQGGTTLPALLKILTWITLILLVVQFFIGQFIGLLIIVKNPEIARNQWVLFKALAAVRPDDSPLMYHFQIISVGTAFGLGLCGLGAGLLGWTGIARPGRPKAAGPDPSPRRMEEA